jgi:FRG domain
VLRAITRLVTLVEPTYVWRGQESVGWPLIPALHRKFGMRPPLSAPVRRQATIDGEVAELIARARAHGHGRSDGVELSDLGLLALLQHNGAATPLLDVTTDPIVALLFACLPSRVGPSEDTDGVLLAIDTRPDRCATFEMESSATWTEALARLKDERRSIGLFTPPMVTPRLMAQRGRFIFGGVAPRLSYATLQVEKHPNWSSGALSELFNPSGPGRPTIPPVVAIRVPAPEKSRLRVVLAKTYGVDAESLFPDLPGFATAHSVTGIPLTA